MQNRNYRPGGYSGGSSFTKRRFGGGGARRGGSHSGNYRRENKDMALTFKYPRNSYIKATSVQVIDENGDNLGELDIAKAVYTARNKELDLIMVAPNAKPPVCRIAAWSKFVYEQQKREKDAKKNKQKEMKELRFGALIAETDKQRLLTRAKDFLDKGHNVKVTVTRRGRITSQVSKELFDELLTALGVYSTIEARPSFQGRMISIVFKAKDGTKAKNQKDSCQKVQADKPEGREETKGSVQQEQTGALQDKKVVKKKG